MTIGAASEGDLLVTAADRAAAGKALRVRVPRSGHSAWIAPPDRSDPLRTLAERRRGRVVKLIPLRNARMAESPFAFYRGSADIMAADLACTPVSGLRVQLCGDAHCLNFGTFATPERRLVFEVTDFDETLPGPWEWDVKRLAASLVLAARSIKLKGENANIAVIAAVRSYRLRMLEFAAKTALDTWYARVDAAGAVSPETDPEARRRRKQIVEGAHAHSMQAALEKLTITAAGGRHFCDDPPLLYHPADEQDGDFAIEHVLTTYAQSLAPEVRVLFGRYRLVDHAVKVVGVGSIGTRSAVALLQADGDDALILQIKAAAPAVLEPYAGTSSFANHGERVVRGQRLMQSAGDVLLGWGTSGALDFYVRQFKDKKTAINIAAMDGFGLREYAQLCGTALAGAHARSGDAAQIAGYLGKADTFDKAIVRFAVLYADQAERDYALFLAAIDAGTIAT
jgi:uncharacterized protein (DUF2252 family)